MLRPVPDSRTSFASNPITNAGATLGRVLFFDPRLSANDRTSCGACHHQALGFSDAVRFSVGFAGALTTHHAPSLVSARFYQRGRFFWDERAATLEDQVLGPIQNPGEMGLRLDALEYKVAASAYYKSFFTAAFGTPDVTRTRIAAALAEYVRSMVSGNSRYDRAFAANGIPNFNGSLTAYEQAGEQVFRTTGCAACHTILARAADGVHITCLDAVVTDSGAGRETSMVPSLRNVGVRTTFMRDGRFTSLEQVVEFYDSGVQPNPFLDERLKERDGAPLRLNRSAIQKSQIVALLKTLTDSAFLTSPLRESVCEHGRESGSGLGHDAIERVSSANHGRCSWHRHHLHEPRQLAPQCAVRFAGDCVDADFFVGIADCGRTQCGADVHVSRCGSWASDALIGGGPVGSPTSR